MVPPSPTIPPKYRPIPQLVRGDWALCHRPPDRPTWKIAWWAEVQGETLLSRRTGIAARLATPDRVVTTSWLEPQGSPEAALTLLLQDQGLSPDTDLPEVEEAPRSLDEIEDKTPSQRMKAVMGYLG